MKIKQLVCGTLIASSLLCGVGCTPKIEYVDRVEYVDREVVVEKVEYVDREIIVEKEVEVEVEKWGYTLITPDECNVMDPQIAKFLHEGDILDKVVIAPDIQNGNYKGTEKAFLGKNIPVLGMTGLTQMSNSYSIESYFFYDYYTEVTFVRSDGSLWDQRQWLVSGTVTNVKRTYNIFDEIVSVEITVDVLKGE